MPDEVISQNPPVIAAAEAVEAKASPEAPKKEGPAETSATPDNPQKKAEEPASEPKKEGDESAAPTPEKKEESDSSTASKAATPEVKDTTAIVEDAIKKSVNIGSNEDRKAFYAGVIEAAQNPNFLRASLLDPDKDMADFLKKDDACAKFAKMVLCALGEDPKMIIGEIGIKNLNQVIKNFEFLANDTPAAAKEANSIAKALKDCEKIPQISTEAKKQSDEFANNLSSKITKNIEDKSFDIAKDITIKASIMATAIALAVTAGPLVAAIALIAVSVYFGKKYKESQAQKEAMKLEGENSKPMVDYLKKWDQEDEIKKHNSVIAAEEDELFSGVGEDEEPNLLPAKREETVETKKGVVEEKKDEANKATSGEVKDNTIAATASTAAKLEEGTQQVAAHLNNAQGKLNEASQIAAGSIEQEEKKAATEEKKAPAADVKKEEKAPVATETKAEVKKPATEQTKAVVEKPAEVAETKWQSTVSAANQQAPEKKDKGR